MKRMLPAFLRSLILSACLLVTCFTSRASHIVGAEMTYKWITCNTYQITIVFYGNCGEASSAAFNTLPMTIPQVCIYDGNTSVATLNLNIIAPTNGVEVTPVCPDSLAYDACTIPTSATPGIKKFIYTNTYTFPHNSANWRIIFNGNVIAGSAPGRAADITNLFDPGGTTLALIDTLNNSFSNTRGHNSSPVLTVEPVPFFCPNSESCYNPGAVDVYDTSHIDEPAGDSLNFALITPENAGGGCNTSLCTYLAIPSCSPGGPLISGSHPLQVVDCSPASFSFDQVTGQLCFNPIGQRSIVVYNIEEYRNDTVTNINTIAGLGAGAFSGDFGSAITALLNKPAGIRTDKSGNIYFADQANDRIRKISNAGIISTVAGNGLLGACGDGGIATAAQLNNPIGVAIDTAGNVIFADNNNNEVRKINVATGAITTIAGNGIAGYNGNGGNAQGTIRTVAGTGTPAFSGDGAAAISADLHNPAGICQDGAGNTYFADYANNRIRKISIGGIISTVGGTGALGYCGDGGPAIAADISTPIGLAIDNTNDLVFTDNTNSVVRKINLTTGIITTIAGNGTSGFAGDGGNAIGFINTFAGTGSAGFSGDGGAAASAALQNPAGICQDAAGNTYFSDYTNNRIRKVSITGVISTIAGIPGPGGYSGDGGPAAAATLNNPEGLCIASNILYFADYNNNVVRKIDLTSGIISTVAGNGVAGFGGDGAAANGPACRLNHPHSVAIGGDNNIYISDAGNQRIRRISPSGVISTFAGNGIAGFGGDGGSAASPTVNLNNPYGLFADASNNVYFADAGNNRIRYIDASGNINTLAGSGLAAFGGDGGVGSSASFNNPTDVFLDASGNVFVSDRGNNCIRKISVGCNIVTTLAGTGGVAGFAGDGLVPTSAKLSGPSFIYLSGTSQNLYISDAGNNRIRIINPCELKHPTGIFVDNVNNTYVSDAGNQRIRKIDPFGTITTIAGNGIAGFAGTGILASLPTVELNNPYGIFVDAANNIYFADAGNNRIRYIDPTGNINTFAGTGTAAFGGDGGSGIAASFNNPTGVFVDIAGNVFVADKGNSCIRKISTATCNFIVTTVAGRGTLSGFSGDGSAPDSAKLSDPSFVFLNNTTHNIYISDYSNNRIREITPCELFHPTGVFVDKFNNTYISDAGNQVVRKIDGATGIINNVAGTAGTPGFSGDLGVATSATLSNPYGLFADAGGNLFIADANNNRIRKVDGTSGIITTVAGSGAITHTGDNCPAMATAVGLNGPSDVSVDGVGNIFIADRLNNCVRKVDVAGNIETLAGTGVAGFSGDGANSYLATLNNVPFLCLDASKNVIVSDFNNNRIRKVDNNTSVNRVMVGSMQREMTFKVLPACAYFAPHGTIDSLTGTTGTSIDSTHLYACQNSGNVILHMNPKEPDTAYHITVTASGLNTGFNFTIDSDNTNHPHATVTGDTHVITPGTYTFYLTYTDNHCPLVGTQTQPFTVQILPAPTIKDSLLSLADCQDNSSYLITPGGYGSPWTIKVSSSTFPYDTLATFSNDTASFVDSLRPSPLADSSYIFTIYTSVSNLCAAGDTITPRVPGVPIDATVQSPSYCGASSVSEGGRIFLLGLPPGLQDTAIYYLGTTRSQQAFISSAAGTDTISGLIAGSYIPIYVKQGNCYDTVTSALNILNPPFSFRTVSGHNPTKCGFCNGVDTLFGLHPGQFDTLTYRLNSSSGISRISTSTLVSSDSFVVFSGLCSGLYDSFSVQTAGVNNCAYTWPGAITLVSPTITPDFDFTIHYGCGEDTIMLNNLSTAAPFDVLYYHWDFGDGTTDVTASPMHVYHNTINDTVDMLLTISNLKCVDTISKQTILNNYVHADFTVDPAQFVCQLKPVTFTNLSTGVNPTYTWIYGDGTTDVTASPVHTFTNSGTYTIQLVASDNLDPIPLYFTPCHDTAIHTIDVDSTSAISIDVTDSVICGGQAITFTGIYAHIGDTGNLWTFGDGGNRANTNPVIHSYDGAKMYTVTVTALYRSCEAQTASRNIRVFTNPTLYLGADTAICPGGAPILLVDNVNAPNKAATWSWSTGDTSAAITVTKPGYYSAMVTIDGCSAYDTVWVQKDCYMDIPNVFTPNGDGTNDYFYPRQLLTKGLVSFKMDIYNRWGQLLYETTNTDGRGWDGTFNGSPQPEGVYIYLIEAMFKDGQIEHHQGNVTLLR